MPIKGENGGYKYKAFINGEWCDLTLSDSPDELTEWLQSNEEWTRVKHGHWRYDEALELEWCSECGFGKRKGDKRWYSYCPNCGAYMGEKTK